MIYHSIELRYIIELGAENLIDNAQYAPTATSFDKLSLMLDRRRRWRMLEWTQHIRIPLTGSCQAYELVGGVFGKSMRGDGLDELWPPGSRHFVAAWLPTRDDKITNVTQDLKRVVKEDLGVPIRDFAIDPTQDVLALVEVDVRYALKLYLLFNQLL